MRTNIDIDDRLMAEAQKAKGTTKKQTVEQALRLMVKCAGSRKSALLSENSAGAVSLPAVERRPLLHNDSDFRPMARHLCWSKCRQRHSPTALRPFALLEALFIQRMFSLRSAYCAWNLNLGVDESCARAQGFRYFRYV
jgi:Arc/MetJ family transcription regulator